MRNPQPPSVSSVADRYLRHLQANPSEITRSAVQLASIALLSGSIAVAAWFVSRPRGEPPFQQRDPLSAQPPRLPAETLPTTASLPLPFVGEVKSHSSQPTNELLERTTTRSVTASETIVEKFAEDRSGFASSSPIAASPAPSQPSPPTSSPLRPQTREIESEPPEAARTLPAPQVPHPEASEPPPALRIPPPVPPVALPALSAVAPATPQSRSTERRRVSSEGEARREREELARVERIEWWRERNDRSVAIFTSLAESRRIERLEEDQRFSQLLRPDAEAFNWPSGLQDRFRTERQELERTYRSEQFAAAVDRCDHLLTLLKHDLRAHGLGPRTPSTYIESRRFLEWFRMRARRQSATGGR